MTELFKWRKWNVTTLTLAKIEAEQNKLADMIAEFKAASRSSTYTVNSATIVLHPGERYAGLLLDDDGAPLHHLILLPEDVDDMDWDAAKAWAQANGGELPTRSEQSLLFANLKSEFESAWYWSSEVYSSTSAWAQHFSFGDQSLRRQYLEFRVRAVRRVPVSEVQK